MICINVLESKVSIQPSPAFDINGLPSQLLLFVLLDRQTKTDSVLTYLALAEDQEPDIWLRDDIRVAWLSVLYAGREYRDPWGFAFWWYFGKTHAKALIAWKERREFMQREVAACMPKEFPLYVTARQMAKKPVQSVRLNKSRRIA